MRTIDPPPQVCVLNAIRSARLGALPLPCLFQDSTTGRSILPSSSDSRTRNPARRCGSSRMNISSKSLDVIWAKPRAFALSPEPEPL